MIYEPKIIFIGISIVAMLVILGFIVGMIATFRIMRFSMQTVYEIKYGGIEPRKNKQLSPEVEMLEDENSNVGF